MGVPAISYRATVNDYYDYGFYRLPNLLSHQCFDLEELQVTLGKILTGELGVADGKERKELIDRYLAAQEGKLACERIIDVLEQIMEGRSEPPKPPLSDRLSGWSTAQGRRLKKWFKSYLPGSHAPPEFHRHRYPEVSLEEMQARVARFQQILGDSNKLQIEKIFDQIFKISPGG
jgi:hypothetical protein